MEPNRVGLGALGGRLEVIPLEVIRHVTDSLDQLIVGKLVLTGISEEEPLAKAIRQSESSLGFDWDIALCLSDLPGRAAGRGPAGGAGGISY